MRKELLITASWESRAVHANPNIIYFPDKNIYVMILFLFFPSLNIYVGKCISLYLLFVSPNDLYFMQEIAVLSLLEKTETEVLVNT